MPAKLSDYIKDREFENGNVLDLGNPRVIALIEAFKADPSIDVLTKEELYSFAFKEGLAVSEEDCNYISGNLYKSDGRVYVQTGHKLGSGAYGEVMLIQEVESGELYALKKQEEMLSAIEQETHIANIAAPGSFQKAIKLPNSHAILSIMKLLPGQDLSQYMFIGVNVTEALRASPVATFNLDANSLSETLAEDSGTFIRVPSVEAEDSGTFRKVPSVEDEDSGTFRRVPAAIGEVSTIKSAPEEVIDDIELLQQLIAKREAQAKMCGFFPRSGAIEDNMQHIKRDRLLDDNAVERRNEKSTKAHMLSSNEVVEMCGVARKMALEVARLHEKGILHRDLKPENIKIAYVDGEIEVNIFDYGVSMQSPDVRSDVGTDSPMGTLNYMPPEALEALGLGDIRSPDVALAHRENLLEKTKEITALMTKMKNSGRENEIPYFYDSPAYHQFQYSDATDKYALGKTIECMLASRLAVSEVLSVVGPDVSEEDYVAMREYASCGLPVKFDNPDGGYVTQQLNEMLEIVHAMQATDPRSRMDLMEAEKRLGLVQDNIEHFNGLGVPKSYSDNDWDTPYGFDVAEGTDWNIMDSYNKENVNEINASDPERMMLHTQSNKKGEMPKTGSAINSPNVQSTPAADIDSQPHKKGRLKPK